MTAGDEGNADRDGSPVRLVIADDQPLILSALSRILAAEDDIDVVARVGSGEEALTAAMSHRADVAVLDVYMPGVGGLSAAAELREKLPGIHILMLTTFGEEDMVHRAMDLGVDGFLVKDCSAEELVAAVRRIHAGGSVLSPEVTGFVMAGYRSRAGALSIPGAVPPDQLESPLTPREVDVLFGVARARSNAEIAADLVVGDATVKTYISRLITKLGVRDRVGLAVWAHETGFLRDYGGRAPVHPHEGTGASEVHHIG